MCNNTLIINVIASALPACKGEKSLRACDIMGKYAGKFLLGTNLMLNLMSVEI